MFPLHLFVGVSLGFLCWGGLFSMLLGSDGGGNIAVWEQLMMVGGAVFICLPVFIYSWCLYCYEI